MEFNSRGVAILFPKEMEDTYKIISVKIDQEERYIIIECNIQYNNIVLVNLYCPTKDHINAQNDFVEKIKNEMEL